MSDVLGLYPKYVVQKANGEALDPEARYFVLRYDNDDDALFAAMMWAARKGNWQLVEDLRKEVKGDEPSNGEHGSGEPPIFDEERRPGFE